MRSEQMSEKRFILSVNEDAPNTLDIIDTVTDKTYNFVNDVVSMNQAKQLVDLLNEQQDTIRKLQDLCGESDYENAKLRQEIKELKVQLREKEEDERLYANEIVKLNKEAKEVLDFKSLGGDY